MPTDFFVRFGTMAQTSESGFWWEDFKETLLEESRAVLIMIASVAILAVVTAVAAKFSGAGLLSWMVIACSVCVGVLHLWFLKKRFTVFTTAERWIYSLLIAVVLFFCVSIAVKLFASFTWLLPAAAVSAFLLPLIPDELWRLLGDLSVSAPQVWYYTTDAPLQKSTTFLNSIPIKMLLHLDEQVTTEQLSFQAPVRMKLGMLLFHTVQEGHAQGRLSVDLTDAAERKAGWVFYTIGLAGQRRYLDPEKGLTENKIKRNAVVHAQRQLPAPDVEKKSSTTKASSIR